MRKAAMLKRKVNPQKRPLVSLNVVERKDHGELMSKEEYFAMLNKSMQEMKEGKIVEVSAEEMRRILSE